MMLCCDECVQMMLCCDECGADAAVLYCHKSNQCKDNYEQIN